MTTLIQDAQYLAKLGDSLPSNADQIAAARQRNDFLEDRHNCANLAAELAAPDAPIGWPGHTEVFKRFCRLHKLEGEAAIRGWYGYGYLSFDGICDTCGRESCANTHTLSQCCHAPLRRLDGSFVEAIDLEGVPF